MVNFQSMQETGQDNMAKSRQLTRSPRLSRGRSPRLSRGSAPGVILLSDIERQEKEQRLSRLVAAASEMVLVVRNKSEVKQLPQCVCVPGSKLIRMWDLFTLFWLIYVALVTPFQMAFLVDNSLTGFQSWLGLFVLDRIIDLTFICDIIVNFRTGWVVQNDDGSSDYKYTCKEGSIKYLRSWFALDVISILPVELFDLMATTDLGAWSRFSKIFKLARLTKLMKILRATRIFSRWEKDLVLHMPYGAIRLLKFLVIFFAVVHWLGCIFFFVHVLEDISGVQFTWVSRSLTLEEQNNIWMCYLASVHWSLATITTVGYGDVKPVATAERVVAVLGMIIGTTMFAFVIGTMISLIEGFAARSTSFQNYMDVMANFAGRVGVPAHLLKRLHNYSFEMKERYDVPYDRVLEVCCTLMTYFCSASLDDVAFFMSHSYLYVCV